MFDRGFIPDAIASRSLTPLLNESADILIALDADWVAHARIAEALGTAYAAGLTDGARHAIGEIAVEAEGRGLRLTLGPELECHEHEA